MLIGILSDTHDRADAAARAVALLLSRGATFLIHCGDVGAAPVLDAMAGTPGGFVFGNNDWDHAALRNYAATLGVQCWDAFADLTLDGKRVAVTHGDEAALVRRARAGGFDYLLHGHTHVARDAREGTLRVLNPGALYRASRKTVALLDPAAGRFELLTVAGI